MWPLVAPRRGVAHAPCMAKRGGVATVRLVAAYGVALALGVLLLEWIDYQRLARTRYADVALGVAAIGFLGLGLFLGLRLARRPVEAPPPDTGAASTLGISARELSVLEALAAGHSTKEIARLLSVSPNTVKTHLARLYAKLDARRGTDAVARARALGILR